ncbi:MAG TPA: hypothetical protein VMV86_06805 [Methanosarcinales archaeon]|nr:hypothetical protein [Methanosarcinales archaeon]
MPTYPWSKQETKETTKKVADKKTSYPWDKPSETKNEVTPIVKKPIPKMTPAQKKVYAEELGLNPKEPLVIPKSPSKQLVVGKGVKKNVVP